MFLLKSLGSIIYGSENGGSGNAGMVQIPSGQLFRVMPSSTATGKPTRQLLFKDATATIKRTNIPHNSQLIITRVFEEGEDELEDGEGEETELVFLIDEVLKFKRTSVGFKNHLFSWINPLDDTRTTSYEFVAGTSTTEATVSMFEMVVYQCMYERRSGKNHTEAADEELEAYINFVKVSAISSAAANTTKASQQKPPVSPAREKVDNSVNVTPMKQQPPSVVSSHFNSPMNTSSPAPAPATPAAAHSANYASNVPNGSVLVSIMAELYVYDNRAAQFFQMRERVEAEIRKIQPYEYYLIVSENGEPYISQPVEPEMNAQFNAGSHAFVWLYREDNSDTCLPWSLRFLSAENEEAFKQAYGAAMYETNNKSDFHKVDAKERDYLIQAYQDDVEMTDVEKEGVEPAEAEEEEDKFESADEEEEEEDDERPSNRRSSIAPGDQKAKISQLTMGHKDRSFFVRGTSIGVLRHDESDTGLEYATVINNVSTLDKQSFTPRKVLLHDQDTSMLMMKPGDDHNIYRMDLNVGKVVEEWKVHDIKTVEEILPDSKKAPMTPNKTLIGLSHNSVFRIDPRLSGQKMVESESKDYSTKNMFSCGVTTGKGELAVASPKGDIRLFNKLSTRAKTHLPGLGDPIIGIDTTENGKWVIATCKAYLLLICTEGKDKSDKGFSGFTKSLGDSKPVPRRLQLKPEHVAFMGSPISFTPARFNTGDDEEKSIITSTGPYVITWNFRRVKQGKLFDYVIKQYENNVVCDDFVFGQDRNIVVALPDDVQMVSKSKLQTPAKMMKSRSSIVNSPY